MRFICVVSIQITDRRIYTHNNIIITPIALTARRTLPVLIPDVSAIRHIIALQPLTFSLSGAFLRDIKLFLSTLGPIWCAYNHHIRFILIQISYANTRYYIKRQLITEIYLFKLMQFFNWVTSFQLKHHIFTKNKMLRFSSIAIREISISISDYLIEYIFIVFNKERLNDSC